MDDVIDSGARVGSLEVMRAENVEQQINSSQQATGLRLRDHATRAIAAVLDGLPRLRSDAVAIGQAALHDMMRKLDLRKQAAEPKRMWFRYESLILRTARGTCTTLSDARTAHGGWYPQQRHNATGRPL